MEVGRRRADQFASMSLRRGGGSRRMLAGPGAGGRARADGLATIPPASCGETFCWYALRARGLPASWSGRRRTNALSAPDPGCRGRCGGPGKAGAPVRAEMQAVRRQRHQALPENAAGAGPDGPYLFHHHTRFACAPPVLRQDQPEKWTPLFGSS